MDREPSELSGAATAETRLQRVVLESFDDEGVTSTTCITVEAEVEDVESYTLQSRLASKAAAALVAKVTYRADTDVYPALKDDVGAHVVVVDTEDCGQSPAVGDSSVCADVEKGTLADAGSRTCQKLRMIERNDECLTGVLPKGWIAAWHDSGLPVYLHTVSGVCTLARPYLVCGGTMQEHSVPIASVPCMQYREAKRKMSLSSAGCAAAHPVPAKQGRGNLCEHRYSKNIGSDGQPMEVKPQLLLQDDCTENSGTKDVQQSGHATPSDGKFKDMDDIVQILSETPALSRVPPHYTGNCYFVVDNAKNNERRSRGRKSQFYDGRLWQSHGASTNKTVFLLGEDARTKSTLTLANGQYCISKQEGGQLNRVPLDTQPTHNNVLVVFRYYAREKNDTSMQRRVTWIAECPPSMPCSILTKALYEYKLG